MGHTEVDALLGAYVLDACEPHEVAAVEVHLDECQMCRAEADRLREAAAWLGVDSSQTPPAKLRHQILGAAEENE